MEGKAPLRILSETAYPLSVASARVRLARFAPPLEREGVTLLYQPTMTEREYKVVASPNSSVRKARVLAASTARAVRPDPHHDLFLVHRLRLLTPFPGLDPPERLDVYDIDDALFVGSAAPVNRRFQWAKQEARRCIQCLRRARLVTVGNSFLADGAVEFARRVEVVPSCVDPSAQPMHTHRPTDVVTVGWIGSSTTSGYLEAVLPAFERLNASRLRAKLVVVGGDTTVRAAWIEHRAWSLEREREDLTQFDIGIMPLPDDDWARGKCGYKVLQYFSAGVPAIASPVGITGELVGEDRGLVASTTQQWLAALKRLIGDVTEREDRGQAARKYVEDHYSYDRWAPELAAMLRSLSR